MIRRLFWLVLGTVFGAWSAYRIRRLARAVTPGGIAGHAAGLGRSVRDFAGNVRLAMHSREEELRDALRLDAHFDDAHSDMDKDLH